VQDVVSVILADALLDSDGTAANTIAIAMTTIVNLVLVCML